MALVNFTHTVPYSAPAATTFLAGHDFGGLSPAAAINALLYDTPRHPVATPQPSPNRRQPTRKKTVVDHRDPYRNQYPVTSTRPPPPPPLHARRKEYKAAPQDFYQQINTAAEVGESQGEESQRRYYTEHTNRNGNINSNSKIKETPPPQPMEQDDGSWPDRPRGYTRIANTFNSAPEPGAKTSVHAVLDFDDDFEDYSYEDEDVEPLPPSMQMTPRPQVTPIEGPILIKNGSVPVVPLYSYPTVNNGSLVQIPILWTALSVALGLEIRGEVIRGVPCIKRFHQLFCPTAGNSYPIDRIERFIDDNKALMKRMYGEFQMSTEYGPPAREVYETKRGVKREAKLPEAEGGAPRPEADQEAIHESFFAKHRQSRQSFRNNQNSESGRVDACESKVEIVTPYWASNSAGKVRAIVNTQHFEQAIHQEVCSKVQTKRCVGDCGCEQKYKWHRLLAYDPDNDCKGIFMDWFLFPSCCVCRCSPMFGGSTSNSNN